MEEDAISRRWGKHVWECCLFLLLFDPDGNLLICYGRMKEGERMQSRGGGEGTMCGSGGLFREM